VSSRVGAAVSTEHDPLEAGMQAAGAAAAVLGGAEPDLAVVFASGAHLTAPEATLAGVKSVIEPQALIGCGAGGVLSEDRELESGTAVTVWMAKFDGTGTVTPFHASLGENGVIDGLPELDGASAAILLPDPYTFPTEGVLRELSTVAPATPVLGGLSSARTREGTAALFLGEEVYADGAVGVRCEGVEVLPCVSQGAAPLGREVTITAAEGNVIYELASRPALETVEQIIAELGPREQTLISAGLLIGIVIDSGQPEYEQGDFLVRGLLSADPDSGHLVVGAAVRAGQVIRLHARDARSADEDLRRALRTRVAAMRGDPPAGALVFSCNGRGSAMFGPGDHDAAMVQRELGGAPSAGFFAAGEIGPVGGRSFLHGFTATLALFPK
jgi:small ligand-binding sensory domain FIST